MDGQDKSNELSDRVLIAMVRDHLPELGARAFPKVAKALGVSSERIRTNMRWVRDNLDAKPARNFVADDQEAHGQYITPDCSVRKIGGEWVVLMNQNGLPKLRLSSYFETLLRKGDAADKKERRYVEERLRWTR